MEKYDSFNLYCRALGHNVPFRYCRTVDQGTPCRRIRDCTYELLPIDEYLSTHYSEQQVQNILKPPQNKLASILEIIEKVKK